MAGASAAWTETEPAAQAASPSVTGVASMAVTLSTVGPVAEQRPDVAEALPRLVRGRGRCAGTGPSIRCPGHSSSQWTLRRSALKSCSTAFSNVRRDLVGVVADEHPASPSQFHDRRGSSVAPAERTNTRRPSATRSDAIWQQGGRLARPVGADQQHQRPGSSAGAPHPGQAVDRDGAPGDLVCGARAWRQSGSWPSKKRFRSSEDSARPALLEEFWGEFQPSVKHMGQPTALGLLNYRCVHTGNSAGLAVRPSAGLAAGRAAGRQSGRDGGDGGRGGDHLRAHRGRVKGRADGDQADTGLERRPRRAPAPRSRSLRAAARPR